MEFLRYCVEKIRKVLPDVQIELRADSAFFSDQMVSEAKTLGLEYTFSVPFERLVELKGIIEKRRRWSRTRGGEGKTHHFEIRWKPKSWARKARILCIRTMRRTQRKGPLQLDLFEPIEENYEYEAIITNKTNTAAHVVKFHEGRGSLGEDFWRSQEPGPDGLYSGQATCRQRSFPFGQYPHPQSHTRNADAICGAVTQIVPQKGYGVDL